MSFEKPYLSHNKLTKPNSFNIDFVKEDVSDILNIEPCPNCSRNLINWKCEDSKNCWYWHWQDYLDKKEEQKEKKSLNMMWNWKKYELITILWEKFNYYDFFWRVKENTANLEIEIKWEIYRFNVEYEIIETDSHKTIENIRFIWSVEIQSKDKKGKIRWKTYYFKYNDLKKYTFWVLADIRFNKFLLKNKN